jgi:hypothetical protein
MTAYFSAATTVVPAITVARVTASLNGVTVSSSATVSPLPVISVGGISLNPVIVGGQTLSGTVVLTTPARAGGVSVSVVSSNPAVAPAPASVLIPQGYTSAAFSIPTTVTPSNTTVQITATYNGSSATASVIVAPIPTVTIVTAEYWSISKILKVNATTTLANSILTFGIDPNGPSIGTMQVETGTTYGGRMNMKTAPATVTVWNSNGGSATQAVIVRAR